MNLSVRRFLFWAPRVLAIVFALFLSLFAFDVFEEGNGVGETILALLIHLVPTFLVVIALALAWRRESLGAPLFVGLAVLYLLVMRGPQDWLDYLLIPGPLLVIGALFCVGSRFREEVPVAGGRTPT